MRLDELDNSWTKSKLNLLFKQAKSDQLDRNKEGNPKINQDGTAKMKSSPLDSRYGQQRALRGAPSKENPKGPVVGAGGTMHDPIDPSTARSLLRKFAGDSASGLAPSYSELPDQSYTWDAMRNRDRRSAPNRQAKWKDGEGKDARSKLYGQKRMMMTPDGKQRVTSNRPAKQTTGSKKDDPPAISLTDPVMVKSMKQKIQDRRKRAELEKNRTIPRRKYSPPVKGKRRTQKEDIDKPKGMGEDFLQALDDSLGI